MVSKKHILNTLNDLDLHYTQALKSSKPQDSVYFSKLAVLEYCGWLEEAFDEIVKRSVKGKLKTIEFRQMLDNAVIGKNNGFQYKTDFRPMLTRAVGLIGAEKIECHLKDTRKYEILISELDAVKSDRNSAAHTWTGVTMSYPAPSYTRSRLEIVYPILRSIYSEVIKL